MTTYRVSATHTPRAESAEALANAQAWRIACAESYAFSRMRPQVIAHIRACIKDARDIRTRDHREYPYVECERRRASAGFAFHTFDLATC